MNSVNKCLVLLLLLALVNLNHCSRYRGSGGRPRTTSRPRYTTARSTTRYRQSTTPYYHQSGTTARPRYSTGTTPRRFSSTTPAWNVPPRPGQTYTTGNQAPQKIKIVNKYNYHYPGYYSLPVQSPTHPGYYSAPSSYHYSSFDTGSTALGLFLGYSLAKLTTPTYSHQSFYDGYRPRYDHYEVHHYYHNKDSVPQNQEIKANTIMGCVGDTVTVCPANTTSLCTSNGALMCVVAATSTVPCADNQQVNCVKSTINCTNNNATECQNTNAASVNIPCVSNARVFGDLKVVNNTIVPTNSTTPEPVTTTASTRRKRDVGQNFCVTVVALPAKKQETEGELFFKDAKFVVASFLDNVLV